MAKRTRSKKVKPAQKLIEQLKIIKEVQKKTGDVQQRHCMILNGWLAATNGVVTIGMRVDEEFNACPNTFQFLAALESVEGEYSITTIDEFSLCVTSEEFRAVIPCVSYEQLQIPAPDANIATINEYIADCARMAYPILNENSNDAKFAGAWFEKGAVVATNGALLIEQWHGLDLPAMLVPYKALQIISKIEGLSGFGYSGPSCTFWSGEELFVKTQLFGEGYPNYKIAFPAEMPKGDLIDSSFFKAVKTVSKFSENGAVYIKEGRIVSDLIPENASSFQLPSMTKEIAFDSRQLLLAEHAFVNVFFDIANLKAVFYNSVARGVVMALNDTKEFKPEDEEDWVDDILF